MQRKTWFFSISTSAILMAFYLFAQSIHVEASGFLIMATVIVLASCFLQLNSMSSRGKQLAKGER